MTNKIIDARGLLCPKPIILTKKALDDTSVKEAFIVLIDNETSKENVQRFLKDNKVEFQSAKTKDGFKITVNKSGLPTGCHGGKIIENAPEKYCTVQVKKKGNCSQS